MFSSLFSINYLLGLVPTWVPWAIVGVGVVLFILEALFNKLVPFIYRLPIRLLAIVIFAAGFYVEGRQDVLISAKAEVEKVVSEQKVVTQEVVKVIHDKVIQDRVIHDQIVKEINTKDDHMCDVPESFVLLHDNAAKGTVSRLPEGVAGSSSGVALSEVERTVADNYELYHELADKMTGIQMWLKEQKRINP
jgi:hypothetical protein